MSYELKQLTDRWVAQWNEPSPDERRRLIREVWTEDGYQLMVNPPAVAMNWVMRTVADGSVAGSGLEVFTFGPDGRVRTDHQFVA
jgi:hypothetical protein